METPWQSWCRLCAQESGTISIFANNSDLNMPDLIKDILHFEIHPSDKAPVTICTTCVQFLSSVFKFTQHASKVQSMYSSMICDHMNTSGSNIKSQFGLVKEEPEWCINDYNQPINALNSHIECSIGDYEFNHVEKKEEIDEIYNPQTDPLHVSVNCGRDYYDTNVSTSSAVQKVPELLSVQKRTDAFSNDTDDDEAKPLKSPIRKMEEDSTKPRGKRKYKKRASADKEIPEKVSVSVENETNAFTHDTDNNGEPKSLNSPDRKTEVQPTKPTVKRKYKKQAPPFPCDLCDQIFLLRTALWRHRAHKHFPKDKRFSCAQCDRAFETRFKLKRHENVHVGMEEKLTHSCHLCDKKFTTKSYVRIHLQTIHARERPFVCEKCGESFPTKSNLTVHNLTHLDEKAFKCSACGKAFKCARALRKHEVVHSETTYPCSICGMELGSRVTLKRHMLVHSDVKRFECKFCSSKFKQSKTLKVHLLTHSGLQPYACPFCDRTFVNGSNCRSHKKKAHPVEVALMEASGETAQPTKLPKLKQLMEVKIPNM